MRASILACCAAAFWLLAPQAWAGPYSRGLNDPTNAADAPIPGFVGPDGEGKAVLPDGQGGVTNPANGVNPLFFGWASSYRDYLRNDPASAVSPFIDPTLALGLVTGDHFDVVSLGDLTASELAEGAPSGQITLRFARNIENKPGADFVVFENGLVAGYATGGSGVGGVFAELAYVEVSSNGADFARFPSVSLTPDSVGAYGSIDPTNVFGLAGKHVNAGGDSWGTPFDLSALAAQPAVTRGLVNLNAIAWVRIVDVPGKGTFLDSAGAPDLRPLADEQFRGIRSGGCWGNLPSDDLWRMADRAGPQREPARGGGRPRWRRDH